MTLENGAHDFSPDSMICLPLLRWSEWETHTDNGDYGNYTLNLKGNFMTEDVVHMFHYWNVCLFLWLEYCNHRFQEGGRIGWFSYFIRSACFLWEQKLWRHGEGNLVKLCSRICKEKSQVFELRNLILLTWTVASFFFSSSKFKYP